MTTEMFYRIPESPKRILAGVSRVLLGLREHYKMFNISLLGSRQDVRGILIIHAFAFHFLRRVASISLLKPLKKEHMREFKCAKKFEMLKMAL